MVEQEPAMKLTKLLADGKDIPDMKTNLMSKEQLMLYNAFDFGAKEYGLDFLSTITQGDKLVMMSVHDHTRTDQAVEGLKAMNHSPIGIDTGLQPITDRGRH
jgi:hypothetical protein